MEATDDCTNKKTRDHLQDFLASLMEEARRPDSTWPPGRRCTISKRLLFAPETPLFPKFLTSHRNFHTFTVIYLEMAREILRDNFRMRRHE